VQRKIIVSKGEEVVGGWRRLLNEELHNLYASTNICRVIKSRRVRWVEYVAPMGKMENAYKILVRKSERKRPLGSSRCRWEENIIMDVP